MLKILRFFYYKIFVNNLFLFICKNVISIIIEFLILILCIYRLLINPFNKKIYVEKNLKKKIFLFKSGTMGDHLICINVLNYFGKYFKFSEMIIVCRKRNIFTQIKDYSRIFKIDLISYFDYIIDLFNSSEVSAAACSSIYHFGDYNPIQIRTYLNNRNVGMRQIK